MTGLSGDVPGSVFAAGGFQVAVDLPGAAVFAPDHGDDEDPDGGEEGADDQEDDHRYQGLLPRLRSLFDTKATTSAQVTARRIRARMSATIIVPPASGASSGSW